MDRPSNRFSDATLFTLTPRESDDAFDVGDIVWSPDPTTGFQRSTIRSIDSIDYIFVDTIDDNNRSIGHESVKVCVALSKHSAEREEPGAGLPQASLNLTGRFFAFSRNA